MGAGILLNGWAVGLFRTKKTTIKPFEVSSDLLMEGPFRFSRNPMYLCMILILSGAVFFFNNFTSIMAPFAMFITLNFEFIPYEEQMLEEKFGKTYVDYKSRVRRWL